MPCIMYLTIKIVCYLEARFSQLKLLIEAWKNLTLEDVQALPGVTKSRVILIACVRLSAGF